MTGEKKEEKKKCSYEILLYRYKCSREALSGDEHCIFHSKDIEGKKDKFNDAFWEEFERQKKCDKKYDFTGFVFPPGFSFKEVELGKADNTRINLMEAKITRADLRKADLMGVDLSRADLSGANLTGVSLIDVKLMEADLVGADLTKADLMGAKLFGAGLLNVKLIGADLTKADLMGDDLTKADLTKADLMGADLRMADLGGADLTEAKLLAVDLRGANLQRANFEKCDITKIKYDRTGSYKGIRILNCYGDPLFVRFAKDQEYLEAFKEKHPYWYKLWLIFADCGRSFLRWALWSILIALVFGFLFMAIGPKSFKPKPEGYTWFSFFYYSIVTFTTLGFGDITPIKWYTEILVTIEVIFGYIMMGGLISIFANILARRS